MPLARLENLLKNLNGNILYVDPGQLDSTDSIENRGNSALRPFKTIQRALLEATRFSYVQGVNNDLFDQTTILLSPGTHYIDNRPGYFVDSDGVSFKKYNGSSVTLNELSLESNFDLNDPNNELYIYNSADGGVIVPKGVSIVSNDLRKTKIRPKYIPDPTNDEIKSSAIFRLTGSCYIYGFTILDGNPVGNVYSNPESETVTVVPNYSHHKLTAFEYADGKNKYVKNGITLPKTDLEMYYYKVSKGYGNLAGYPIIIDGYNDLQPNSEENKIVGDLGLGSLRITSIIAGDGISNASNIVTVTTASNHGLSPLSSILVSGVGNNSQQRLEYNGSFSVAQVISSTSFTYRLTDIPQSTLAPFINTYSKVTTVSDTVSSSSPYVFNCSLKSIFGMNGLHADGSKATGFKSIVTAQFTGISLQKDDRAFVLYSDTTGTYLEQTGTSNFLHQDSRSVYKPSWEHYHIRASNDAFIQCVSIFAIGYSKQFISDNGGDQSITNSNSNFGSISLSARGFKEYSLSKDNHAFITHIIPPKEIANVDTNINCLEIDTSNTLSRASSNSNTRVYLKGYNNLLVPPSGNIRSFTIGGRTNDQMFYKSGTTEHSATISPNYKLELSIDSTQPISTTDTFTLSQSIVVGSVAGLSTSQAVKIVSNNAILPDGIENDKVYYIHKDLTSTTFKLSENIFNSTSDTGYLNIKSEQGLTAGNLKLVSKVSFTNPGDVGSPIQFDSSVNQWYIKIATNPNFINSLSGTEDPTFYVKRVIDNRNFDDKLYRARLVIPKTASGASDPSFGYVIERSSSAISSNYTLVANSISSLDDARNTNQIVDAWSSVSGDVRTAHIITKNPHNLKAGNSVNIFNLKSSNEPAPVGMGTGTGYNGAFSVASVIDDLHFTYVITRDPGTISTLTQTNRLTWMNERSCSGTTYRIPPYTTDSDSTVRTNLPYFTCEKVNNDYQLYNIKTIQSYSEGSSDGVYHVTLNTFKNIPSVSPFNTSDLKLSQSIENLYPELDIDNPISDPYPTKTIASRKLIGKVDINTPENSVTKETVSHLFKDFGIGFDVTQITKSGSNCTITTSKPIKLRGAVQYAITTAGSGFVNGTWYDIPVCGGSGVNATVNVTVSGGAVTSIQASNPGSGYVVGDTIQLKGIPHSTTNQSVASASVATVDNSDLTSIQVLNSINPGNDGFFPITSVTYNTITYANVNGSTETNSTASAVLSGATQAVATVSGTTNTTITTSLPHSLVSGNKVYFQSINQTFNVISATETSFVVDGNASSVTPASNFYSVQLSPSLRDTNSTLENLSSRHYSLFDGYQNRITSAITTTASTFTLSNTRGLQKTDFVQIDDEIMMITSVAGVTAFVQRGIFNTKIAPHASNSLVRRIKIIPVELRRNSIIRASGHTFEYTGYGPGNYSTGMPTNQNRVLSDDEILISQSLNTRGGSVLYTGMNSNGEFYIGKKKINALTGEEIYVGLSGAQTSGNQNFSDSLTVNNLTVVNNLNASTAEVTANNLTVINDLTVDTDVSVGGSVTAYEFSGYGSVPLGAIILWSGATVPAGWALCNGQTVNGILTPDLRNRFVVATGGEYTIGNTGGSDSINLTTKTYLGTEITDVGSSFDVRYNFVCSRSSTDPIANATIQVPGGSNIVVSTSSIANGANLLLPQNSNLLVPETVYNVTVTGTPRINAIDNKTLEIEDGVDGDFNDLVITPKVGKFYIESSQVKYVIDVQTGTDFAVGGAAIDNRSRYYALAYIMRVDA